jgi:uncharacterized heparinase superfamily protein
VNGKEKWNSLQPVRKAVSSSFYKEEGHFILRKRTAEDKEIYCHFDAAPLGYLSIAAHGHADALSFILHADGCPFIVDPGTYAYHTHSDWRRYFTGTLAHNTVTIDKKNQAILAGPTLWLNHFDCKVITATVTQEKDIITATHNGYADKGVSHTRTLVFDKVNDSILLTDTIEANESNYLVNMPLHLHPDVTATHIGDNMFLLKHAKTSVSIEVIFDMTLAVDKIEAGDADTLGWYSDAFMKKERSSVLMGEYPSTNKKLVLHTTINILNS